MDEEPARDEARAERLARKPMTPFQKIAMGLVIVAVDTLGGEGIGAYDLLPDVVGWAMVVWGLVALDLPERKSLIGFAAFAGLVSLVLWFPQMQEKIREAELALRWATSLPDLAFVIAAALAFKSAAQRTKDRRFAGRFGTTLVLAVVVAVMPVIADAADSDQLLAYAELGFVLLWVWLIWNLFAAQGRPWAEDRNAQP